MARTHDSSDDSSTDSTSEITKTRWLTRIPLILLVAATMALGVYVVLHPAEKVQQRSAGQANNSSRESVPADFTYDTISLETDGSAYQLQVADTTAKQQLGLGQRDTLPTDQGMLFPYQTPGEGERCFWMKDMRFAIDIIWLDADKKIVTIEADVEPETYPQNFCPTEPAQYVIELNAGQAAKAGLQTGQTLRF